MDGHNDQILIQRQWKNVKFSEILRKRLELGLRFVGWKKKTTNSLRQYEKALKTKTMSEISLEDIADTKTTHGFGKSHGYKDYQRLKNVLKTKILNKDQEIIT